MSRTGLILFAHGSRDPQWRAPMEAVATRASTLAPEALVRCAYLELMSPDLPACVADLAAQGVSEITILPMFLGVGRHAREDLPILVDDLRRNYPAIQFVLRTAIGEDARVVEMLAQFALNPSA